MAVLISMCDYKIYWNIVGSHSDMISNTHEHILCDNRIEQQNKFFHMFFVSLDLGNSDRVKKKAKNTPGNSNYSTKSFFGHLYDYLCDQNDDTCLSEPRKSRRQSVKKNTSRMQCKHLLIASLSSQLQWHLPFSNRFNQCLHFNFELNISRGWCAFDWRHGALCFALRCVMSYYEMLYWSNWNRFDSDLPRAYKRKKKKKARSDLSHSW